MKLKHYGRSYLVGNYNYRRLGNIGKNKKYKLNKNIGIKTKKMLFLLEKIIE